MKMPATKRPESHKKWGKKTNRLQLSKGRNSDINSDSNHNVKQKRAKFSEERQKKYFLGTEKYSTDQYCFPNTAELCCNKDQTSENKIINK